MTSPVGWLGPMRVARTRQAARKGGDRRQNDTGRERCSSPWQQEIGTMEIDIFRLNIEKFKRMLETETDESSRRTIERMIKEFEGISSSSGSGSRFDAGKAENQQS